MTISMFGTSFLLIVTQPSALGPASVFLIRKLRPGPDKQVFKVSQMWATKPAFEPGSRGGLHGARGRLPTPSQKSLSRSVPRASQPLWRSPGSPPRALGPPRPPVDAPRLQVAQRPLIKPQHLLLVGQVGSRHRQRHDYHFTFSGRGVCREAGRRRRGGGASGGRGDGRPLPLPPGRSWGRSHESLQIRR